MFQLYISNQAKKDIKRLDKPVIKKLVSVLEEIAENPFLGEPLKGELSHLKKWKLIHFGVEYRIAYLIIEDRVEVRVLQVGTRENFYNELKRRI